MKEAITALKTARILISCHHGGSPTRGPDHDLLRSIDILLEEEGLGRLDRHLAANAGRGRFAWLPSFDQPSAERFALVFSTTLARALPGTSPAAVRGSVRTAIAAVQTGRRIERLDRGVATTFLEKLAETVLEGPMPTSAATPEPQDVRMAWTR